MAENNQAIKNIKNNLQNFSGKARVFLARWFFLISFLLAAMFCVFVWYKFIWKSEWDEAKKQNYINEQAKFSFSKAEYQRMMEKIGKREDKFQNFPKFSGKDIFFPEGW